MFHLLELELSALFFVCWGLSLVAMWFLVNRKTRPGPIRSIAAIEGMMLVSIGCLILAVAFLVWGTGAVG